ncbi:uncharacterized protein JN550_004344 [Neoarthrinium moseri]|uniref:uncharacterized protein n=1 Tax=Neoarthrinium moseri TaxID=1658444 RepID=UPI001FDC5AAF|nr:uncharacterized protein JN550_004344 [Neoarthrinium moseri]KAI1872141.1 hypothetical protein JN550_004344 [Neoarthrinium moseri]
MGKNHRGENCANALKQLRQTRTCERDCMGHRFYIQRCESARIVKGRLITKAQTVIVPASGSWEVEKVIDSLLEVVNSLEDHICPHRTWKQDIRRNLIPQSNECAKKRDFGDQSLAPLSYPSVGVEMRCLLCHGRKCTQSCQKKQIDKAEVGCPGSCSACFTDFSVNAVELPGMAARALVLTTWRNLGSGANRCSKEWNSFERPRRPGPGQSSKAHRATIRQGREAVFRCFEEVNDPNFSYGGPNHIHRPRVEPLDLMRLREFPDRLEFEDDICGEPHRPGSDGIIYHPDPID